MGFLLLAALIDITVQESGPDTNLPPDEHRTSKTRQGSRPVGSGVRTVSDRQSTSDADKTTNQLSGSTMLRGKCCLPSGTAIPGIHVYLFAAPTEGITSRINSLARPAEFIYTQAVASKQTTSAPHEIFADALRDHAKTIKGRLLGTTISSATGNFEFAADKLIQTPDETLFVTFFAPQRFCIKAPSLVDEDDPNQKFTFTLACSLQGLLPKNEPDDPRPIVIAIRALHGDEYEWRRCKLTDDEYRLDAIASGKWQVVAVDGMKVLVSGWFAIAAGSTGTPPALTSGVPGGISFAVVDTAQNLPRGHFRLQVAWSSLRHPESGSFASWKHIVYNSVHTADAMPSLSNLSPGRYSVELFNLSVPSFSPITKAVIVNNGVHEHVQIEVEPTPQLPCLTINILNAAGEGAPDVPVTLYVTTRYGRLTVNAKSDESGHATIRDVPVGEEMLLTVHRPDNKGQKRIKVVVPRSAQREQKNHHVDVRL